MSDPNNLRMGYAHLAVQNELAAERALTDDLADVLNRIEIDLLDKAEVERVLVRYREARQR